MCIGICNTYIIIYIYILPFEAATRVRVREREREFLKQLAQLLARHHGKPDTLDLSKLGKAGKV